MRRLAALTTIPISLPLFYFWSIYDLELANIQPLVGHKSLDSAFAFGLVWVVYCRHTASIHTYPRRCVGGDSSIDIGREWLPY